MAACMPYLREQLELVAPKVIVALGATAVQGLFGTSEGITRLRGHWKLYRHDPGHADLSPRVPAAHPRREARGVGRSSGGAQAARPTCATGWPVSLR